MWLIEIHSLFAFFQFMLVATIWSLEYILKDDRLFIDFLVSFFRLILLDPGIYILFFVIKQHT